MSAPTLRFTVLGLARTKGSAKAFMPRGWTRPVIVNDNPKAKAWEQLIAQQAVEALARSRMQPFTAGPIAIDLAFYFPRPQKFLTKKYAAIDVPHTTRPDADKMARCAIDALTRVVWHDDAQVVDLHAHKHYCAIGEMPRVEITVTALSETAPSHTSLWPEEDPVHAEA